MRVDQEGIATRWFRSWVVWTWDALRSGKIRFGLQRHQYDWPGRPWWRRELHVSLLDESEREFVAGIVRGIYRLTVPPAVPDEVSLTVGFRQKWRLTKEGIAVTIGHKTDEYRWDDVRKIEVHRLEHGCRDFRKLQLQLPDRKLDAQVVTFDGPLTEDSRGAWRELVMLFFERCVPAERWFVTAIRSPTLPSAVGFRSILPADGRADLRMKKIQDEI